MLDKFEEQRKIDQQSIFREKEVQNLRDLIYGTIDSTSAEEEEQDDLIVDTHRYDVHHSKLEIYLKTDVKKLLKSKFVTGQTQEQIMKNLLNMSDSDEEDDKKIKKMQKREKALKAEEGSEESEEDSDEEIAKPKKTGVGRRGQGEDLRATREAERKRREEEEKKKADDKKRLSLFLGESHGHYKMGSFVRIELQVQKKFSRSLVPEYPVILCSLRH